MYKFIVMIVLMPLLLAACVQPSYQRVVVVTLSFSPKTKVHTAGIRGEGKPLSWYTDYPMQELVKDSLYRALITTQTAYSKAEFKFTRNGEFEFENGDNRIVAFNTNDTTYYQGVFNSSPKE
jgi:hypothetical protein